METVIPNRIVPDETARKLIYFLIFFQAAELLALPLTFSFPLSDYLNYGISLNTYIFPFSVFLYSFFLYRKTENIGVLLIGITFVIIPILNMIKSLNIGIPYAFASYENETYITPTYSTANINYNIYVIHFLTIAGLSHISQSLENKESSGA
jgi:hypothetical protein